MLGKFSAFVSVILLALLGFMLYEAHRNNQVVPPFGTKPSPTVQQLPSYVSLLRRTKDACEAELALAHTTDGRRPYEAVRTSSSGLIDYLRTGLARRLNEDDDRQIQRQLKELESAIKDFDSWRATSTSGGGPQLTVYYQAFMSPERAIPAWLDGVRNQNEIAIERLRADLEACRMGAWRGSPVAPEAPAVGSYQPRIERQAQYPPDDGGWRPARPR